MVEFTIYGDKLVPQVITDRLGITPNEQWRKGEKVPGRSYPRRHSNWSLSTDYETSLDVDDQLKKIYNLLKTKIQILKEIKDEYNLGYQIVIIPNIEDNEIPYLHFDRWILEFINDIEATIDIDLMI
jgi:hypothetical protein